ncbi:MULTISPECIES: ATP-binding protein [unclassified Moorena]|uniref:ATP-binding protein n=1 Tax=unclassified Moorena TaxID=2683338 RepID=UPI0013C6F30C|nr:MULTISPECIES: ATP-binding protein [unclassified Moorena]NEO21305.1 ATP-binding protein [Moorena sp. SIO4A5]NEQ62010.1 ATP-binding protein [Moorena sp. SIO4A1]
MAPLSQTNWYHSNISSLFLEIERVRNYLEKYIEGKENQQIVTEIVDDTSALAQLCYHFYLSPFERDILLMCVGQEIEPMFQSLVAIAQKNHPHKNYPTLSLAIDALPGASWHVLSPQSPLFYWQLLQIEPGRILTKSPLHIDQQILCFLLGYDATDQELAGKIIPQPPQTNPLFLPPSQLSIGSQLKTIWSGGEGTNSYPVVQLSGSDRTTKYQIASATCQDLGKKLHTLDPAALTTKPQDVYQLAKRWQREAKLSNSVLFIDCDSYNFSEPGRESALSKFIDSNNTRLILSSNDRKIDCQRTIVNLDIPPLSHQEQYDLWESHIGSAAAELNGQLERIAVQFNLNTATIQAACDQFKIQNSKFPQNPGSSPKSALTHPYPLPGGEPGGDRFQSPPELGDLGGKNLKDETHQSTQLWDICRHFARNQLDHLAQPINATATWDDLVLPTPQRLLLSDIATHLRHQYKVYQQWGFAQKGDRGLGISALFYGASGTGKTMAAEVLAQEFRLDLYRIDLSRVVSKYIGETEKNLRRIFDAAETGSAILLFDEADALFGKRTQVKDSHDRHANIEVSYLLQRMEAYQGLAILTTNFQSALDSAFSRRIRFVVEFPFPGPEIRTQIWQRIFPAQTPTLNLNYQKLGQLNIAGGNIRNIALNAAFLAAAADEAVNMELIYEATKREYLKLKKMLTNEEIEGWF